MLHVMYQLQSTKQELSVFLLEPDVAGTPAKKVRYSVRHDDDVGYCLCTKRMVSYVGTRACEEYISARPLIDISRA